MWFTFFHGPSSISRDERPNLNFPLRSGSKYGSGENHNKLTVWLSPPRNNGIKPQQVKSARWKGRRDPEWSFFKPKGLIARFYEGFATAHVIYDRAVSETCERVGTQKARVWRRRAWDELSSQEQYDCSSSIWNKYNNISLCVFSF